MFDTVCSRSGERILVTARSHVAPQRGVKPESRPRITPSYIPLSFRAMGIDRVTITVFSSWDKAHWTGCETKRQPTGHHEALQFWLDVNSRSNLQDHAQLNAVRFLGIRRKL